jgi:hypothetical protein
MPALLRAMPACLGTALAVIVGMLFTFGGTGIADVSADAANFLHEARSSTHVGGASPAHFRAVNAQTSAMGPFPQASICTMIALLGTLDASLDTGLMLLMRHKVLLYEKGDLSLGAREMPHRVEPGTTLSAAAQQESEGGTRPVEEEGYAQERKVLHRDPKED